jgi:hypothetical protein
VDSKYTSGESGSSYVTGKWTNHRHLTLESGQPAKSFTVFAVFWPERGLSNSVVLSVKSSKEEGLAVSRPDGKVDHIHLTDDELKLD